MKKKIVMFLTALSLVASVTSSFAISASAVDATDEVSVAAVTEGVEFVYDEKNSTELTRKFQVKLVNCDNPINGLEVLIPLSKDLVESVDYSTPITDSDFVDNLNCQWRSNGKLFLSTAMSGFEGNYNNQVLFDVTLTLKSNTAFDLVLEDAFFFDKKDNAWSDNWDFDASTITIPKYTTKTGPDPISTTGTKVVRHIDGLDTPAEYWVAELDPATATFNTIKVVATDSTGATAEDTKTITTLTGDAVISVHIAILNATNEVSKVDVTASYVE